MAVKLKRGGLGGINDPSPVPNAFADSMAKAMEDALNDLLADEGNPSVPIDNSRESRDRRIMFLAISRGIVDHLVAREEAFEILDDDGDVQPLRINIRNE